MSIRKFTKREGKRLARYLRDHPESASNAIFMTDVLDEVVDEARFDLLEAAKNVIGERMLAQIDPKMKSAALDVLEKVLYKIQKEEEKRYGKNY